MELLSVADVSTLSREQLTATFTLRPSTLLVFLMASAPGTLPLPSEILTGRDFLDDLFDPSGLSHKGSYRSLYVTSGTTTAAGRIVTWGSCSNEKKAWLVCQECLDLFIQRLSVMESKKSKEELRKHYELILDLGNRFFS